MSDKKPEPKIGAGHASAMARLGLAELRAAFAFSDSNIVQPSPYGIYGTKTPGEVQNERESGAKDKGDDPPSILQGRGMGPEENPGHGQDPEPPEPERD